ncbi:cell wall protein DAN4 isoform X2 [Drosophila santomea]|uniref:cell wall protein DAN4 isoform X2 n=1 Tax=Drosophila santomea TaxID=129105 RepID=UPI001952F8F2|nr:cell wall protein DAN4 isoform X2 [Drosophila santomea]
MLGKVKSSIIVIYMTTGLLYILLSIKASSTFMRPKRQMWPVDHPSIVLYRQHPNAMRKFYWYNTRTPILVGKMRLKNYMRNMQMLPRYVHSPVQFHEAYANSKRSIFRDLSNVNGFKAQSPPTATATSPVDFVAAPLNTIEYSSAPVNPPVAFSVAPVNAFVPLTAGTLPSAERLLGPPSHWNHSESQSSNDGWKKCRENCLQVPYQEYAKDQYGSQSMTSDLPVTTTTTLPYFNYVAHTYFTLDDVILPHSASKLPKSPAPDQQFRPSIQVLTTERPQQLFTELFQPTTPPPTATTTTTTTAFTFPGRTTVLDMEYRYSTRPSWFSPTTSSTTTTEAAVSEDPPKWTTPQPVQSVYSTSTANVTKGSYKHRLKSLKATKNFSSSIETKLKLLKLHLKNLVTTKETPKNDQNLTTPAILDNITKLPETTTTTTAPTPRRRTSVNRKLRKLRVLASTKQVPVQISRNSTDSSKAKKEFKKTLPKRIYQRRKHLNTTAMPEPTKNTTVGSESINKLRRRTTASTRKSTNVDDSVIIRNATQAISHTLPKSRADGIAEEKHALVTESAIMTISSGTLKMRQPHIKARAKPQRSRKIAHLENDNFIPSLPIEVFFKKVNQQ